MIGILWDLVNVESCFLVSAYFILLLVMIRGFLDFLSVSCAVASLLVFGKGLRIRCMWCWKNSVG